MHRDSTYLMVKQDRSLLELIANTHGESKIDMFRDYLNGNREKYDEIDIDKSGFRRVSCVQSCFEHLLG
jgi:hypothetical protein